MCKVISETMSQECERQKKPIYIREDNLTFSYWPIYYGIETSSVLKGAYMEYI